MLETNEPDERVAAAYRDAEERMRSGREDAVRRTQAAMKSTAGWQAAAKAAAAQSVLEATRNDCDALVTRLIEAHVDSGEEDAERVAESVRQRFLRDLTAPGRDFFPTSGPESAALAVVALRHAADFESFRDQLAAEVAERFRKTLAGRERRPHSAIAPQALGQRLRDNRFVFAFLVVTAMLSLGGVSWMDMIRRAAGWL